MTDLERVKQYHDWLKDHYVIENHDNLLADGQHYNQELIVGRKGEWYWIYYQFEDGKLVHHYVSE